MRQDQKNKQTKRNMSIAEAHNKDHYLDQGRIQRLFGQSGLNTERESGNQVQSKRLRLKIVLYRMYV